jgi:hypothetical protein
VRRCLPLLAVTVFLAGCGSSGPDTTPAACLEGGAAYLHALAAAPGAVTLDGATPISACLPDAQAAGDQEAVGTTLVRTATVLNAAARRDPGGPRNVQLGYLVGAVEAGTGDSMGIHADLLRRVQAAARYEAHTGLTAAFDLAYARGYAAGRSQG